MKTRKPTWNKERIIFPAFFGVIKEQGNSARFYPAVPREYVGKKAVLVILEEEGDIYERD